MPLKKFTLKTAEKDRGKRLDQALADWLPEACGRPISKAKVRKLVVAGAVYLNGRRLRIASKTLLPNARVEVWIDFAKLDSDGKSHDRAFEMTAADILYEQGGLLAVNKPAGLPTQPTLDESRDNLFAAVKRFLAKRDGTVQPYLGLHHRLDRDTSGVVLFTTEKTANAAVADLFAGRNAQKTYLAIAERRAPGPSGNWSIKNHLGKAPGPGKKARFTEVRSGGDFAHTDFEILSSSRAGPAEVALVQAMPRTGRTHQIRVHLAECGLPILGDSHYGGPTEVGGVAVGRVMLHARRLEFPLSGGAKPVVIESPLPADFEQCLAKLKLR